MHALENLQSLQAIRSGLHRKAALFQKAADGVADQHGIVDHERYCRHEFATCGMHAPGPQTSRAVLPGTRRNRASLVTMVISGSVAVRVFAAGVPVLTIPGLRLRSFLRCSCP